MRQILTILIILSFIGCKKQEPMESKLPEKYLGLWQLTISKNDTLILSSAQLILNKNNTYEYFAEDEAKFEVFSHGSFKIINDTIILNSQNPKECYYIYSGISYDCKNFDKKNYENNIVVKPYFEMPTTVKNCKPNGIKKMYGKFDNEKLLIKNNEIIYLTKEFDCSKYISGMKLKITK